MSAPAVKLCANGDGRPVCPPSKVICRECTDNITATLHGMLKKAEEAEALERRRRREAATP